MGFTFDFNGRLFGPIDNDAPLFLIAGPCVIESREQALETAGRLKDVCAELDLPLIYKSSFDKANRSSGASWRGPGMNSGLAILAEVRERVGLPVITDIHDPAQASPVAEVADMIQIPAFLCRQTDLIMAAAATGRPLNIKKGQFLAPCEMANILAKASEAGNHRVCLCERGTSFGYGNLVVDMRGLEIMKQSGAPVIFDATHSVQLPGALGKASGGERKFVPVLSRAAVAAGIAGLFLEVHPNPDNAPCDGPNMLELNGLKDFLRQIQALDAAAKNVLPACGSSTNEPSVQRAQTEMVEKLGRIRLVISDVDGVLTDGGLYYGADGECLKKFNARDGVAIKRLQKSGIQFAVLSGRDSKALRARLADLGISSFSLGQGHKGKALAELMKSAGVGAGETLYIGDDMPDMDIFPLCGIAATVADAPACVRKAADIVLKSRGGAGALREFAELLLQDR